MKTYRFPIVLAASLLALVACGGTNQGEESKENTGSSDNGNSEPLASSSIEEGQSSQQGASEPSINSSVPGTSSSSAGGSSSTNDDCVIKEPTNITIWTTYNDTYQTIINNAIDEFKKMEPNVTITNTKQQGSYDDLKKMVVDGFAVDNYPDIVAAYPDSVADFINNFKGLDVDPYMNDPEIGWSQDDFDDIPEAIIEAGQNYAMPGTYSLPCSKSTEAMYYNQDVLIGLNLSSVDPTINSGKPLNDNYLQNLTWEELFDKLVPALDAYDQAQTEANKIIDRTTYADWAWVGYDSDDNFFITLAEQYGYGYTAIDEITGKGKIEFDNDGMKNLMKKFADYNTKHYFTTKGVIKENVNYRSTKDAMLFSIGSTGGVKYQFDSSNPHNVGVAPIPQAAGKTKKVISQGPDFAFLDHENENRAKATWMFYKLFTNTKYNSAWALATGYSPIRYSVMETKDYLAYADASDKDPLTLDRLYALNAKYAAEAADLFFTSPVFKGSSEARTQVSTIYAACVAAGNDLNSQIDGIFSTAVNNTRLKM
ncbi:MAG: extracellular solute-binding protein [Bacilli bacterium]|nr:extracellular solute-binding protein [Bacilli bacterium]